jgi:hypothetical protein
MDHYCQCDSPDASLLRVVMIGEIIQADEDELYDMAEVLDALGFMHLLEPDEEPPPPTASRGKRKRKGKSVLRRVK